MDGARMEQRRSAYWALVERPDAKRPSGRLRRIREDDIKWMFKKSDGEACTGLIWLWIGTGGGRL